MMAVWRDDKILELANQLTYSNADKRREQLDATIALASGIDAAKSYPWDFIHFRITGFQPVKHSEHTLSGKVLRADLSTLIEFLSDTLSIKIEDAVDPNGTDSVLTMEEVSKKFTVSSKTIQRWRKQGLIALRYVYEDGRRRLGFLDSEVGRFAGDNKERLERSATFKQLSADEKEKIVRMARRLAPHSNGDLKEVAVRIGRKLNRSAEAVHYAIRRYDHEHPEAAIFSGPAQLMPERGAILECYHGGASVEQIAERYHRTRASIARIIHHERAATLKSTPIECVVNPLFDHPDADQIILTLLPSEAVAKAQASIAAGINPTAGDVYMVRTPHDLPAFLQDIFRQPIMPHELATDAFRRMNYLKWKAAKLQRALQPNAAATADLAAELAAIEGLLAQAHDLKNLIVESNLRVAVHVARKHQRADRPLIELFSDATIWLMRAVDTFDFSRPTRFTTYASYSIMKNFARHRAEQLTQRETNVLTGQDEALNSIGTRETQTPADGLDAKALQHDLLSVLHELPARERELLTHHYGLNEQQPPLSLSEIGDKMGITKARVRQLEARALRKLRQLLDTRREKLHKATMKS